MQKRNFEENTVAPQLRATSSQQRRKQPQRITMHATEDVAPSARINRNAQIAPAPTCFLQLCVGPEKSQVASSRKVTLLFVKLVSTTRYRVEQKSLRREESERHAGTHTHKKTQKQLVSSAQWPVAHHFEPVAARTCAGSTLSMSHKCFLTAPCEEP